MRGRAIPLSKPRRTVIDLLYFAKALPTVPVQRRMDLGAIVAARTACCNRPQWTAIFAKAYALVAREFPELRRAYVKFPWPHFYEYPVSVASIVIERDYQGEPSLFLLLVKDPVEHSLSELRHIISHGASDPINSVKDYRRSLNIAGLPRPVRRMLWWLGLNIGRQRANYFGTFGLSVFSVLNADSLHPLSPLTTLLNYGFIASDGSVDVRIVYDHRVMDGATVGRALARLEEVLNGPIAEELRSLERAQSFSVHVAA